MGAQPREGSWVASESPLILGGALMSGHVAHLVLLLQMANPSPEVSVVLHKIDSWLLYTPPPSPASILQAYPDPMRREPWLNLRLLSPTQLIFTSYVK